MLRWLPQGLKNSAALGFRFEPLNSGERCRAILALLYKIQIDILSSALKRLELKQGTSNSNVQTGIVMKTTQINSVGHGHILRHILSPVTDNCPS